MLREERHRGRLASKPQPFNPIHIKANGGNCAEPFPLPNSSPQLPEPFVCYVAQSADGYFMPRSFRVEINLKGTWFR